ncbi:MAG: WbqC family protein [bacterium]|nr:WbqC family protein [bacterium]
MIISCHQPNYIPWTGYFCKMKESDIFVLLDSVQFPRGVCKGTSWVNRNRIKTSNGELWLSVPVKKKGRGLQSIKDVEINNDTDLPDGKAGWRKKHFLSLWHFYKKAPYFNEYIDFFNHIYNTHWDKLVDLNIAIIKQISIWLDIKAQIICSSELGLNTNKTQLLADICNYFKADTYIAGAGGSKYMDLTIFENSKIKVRDYRFGGIPYPQFWGKFVPNLSVVDILFNCGKKGFEMQFSSWQEREVESL